MAGDDMGERTERPTPRKLEKARDRGQVPKSQDLSASVALLAALILLILLGSSLLRDMAIVLERVIAGRTPGDLLSIDGVLSAARFASTRAAITLIPLLLVAFLVAYLANVLQFGFLLTLEPVKPKLSKINPAAGIKRLVGMRNLVKSAVGFLKLIVVTLVATLVLRAAIPRVVALPRLSAPNAMHAIAMLALELAAWLLAVLLLLAIVDLIYERWQHIKDLKMTKHEVKDERRSMEGDPQVKKRRLQMAMDIATQRIRRDVPSADVVISNPTHFAVALRYDAQTMRAPRLVAKGADLMALRIRQVAAAHAVPIVERPPLARAIYWGVDEGREIPPHLYEAVAEILAYVYRTERTLAA